RGPEIRCLAEDGGLLPVEFFVGEDALVMELFQFAQLIIFIGRLGRSAGTYGWVCLLPGVAGVIGRRWIVDDDCRAAVGGKRPHEGTDPTYDGPAQQEIEGEDAAGIALPAHDRDDRRQEIGYQQEYHHDPAENAGKEGEEDVVVEEHILKVQKLICRTRAFRRGAGWGRLVGPGLGEGTIFSGGWRNRGRRYRAWAGSRYP